MGGQILLEHPYLDDRPFLFPHEARDGCNFTFGTLDPFGGKDATLYEKACSGRVSPSEHSCAYGMRNDVVSEASSEITVFPSTVKAIPALRNS